MDNTRYFRDKSSTIGLEILPGEHPIVPVMFGDAMPAVKMAEKLLAKGVYVIAFSFPVVPKGKARFERRFRPHTHGRISIWLSRNSRGKGRTRYMKGVKPLLHANAIL